MPVDDEVLVGRLLVLADARLDQRSVFQGREAEGQMLAHTTQRIWVHHAFSRRRIEGRSARVIGYFKPAPSAAGDSIEKMLAVVAPHGQMRVVESRISRRRPEEKNILLGGPPQIADRLREQFSQPRSAGKHVVVGLEPGAVGKS